jgi:hypothetical protein
MIAKLRICVRIACYARTTFGHLLQRIRLRFRYQQRMGHPQPVACLRPVAPRLQQPQLSHLVHAVLIGWLSCSNVVVDGSVNY